ncbi:MAG: CNNM domain-containing protein [Verrucomicrobiae bacterium]|nr:CNNM domain-containing protein [Verrucomicrobiae bacterium]
MWIVLLLLTALLLLVNAFFVLAEFAAVKMRPTRVEELASRGDRRAKVLQHIQQHIDEYLSVCQVGITLASIGLGFAGKPAFERLIATPLNWLGVASPAAVSAAAVTIAYLLVSFLHILLGELVPKSVAIRRPEASSLWIAMPLRIAHFVFFVPLWVLNASANLVLRLLRLATPLKDPAHTENEIRIIMERSQSSGLISFRRLLLMENVFDMGALKVRDAMKGRDAVKTLRLEAPWSENLALIRDSKYSRFPLVTAGEELPLGIVHVKDILHLELNKQESPDLTKVMRPYLKVNEDMPLEGLLTELQRHRRRVGIVTNAKGQWVGFITLEDVVEEIIGSVEDEFEKEPPLFLADVMSKERIVFDVSGVDIYAAIRNLLARVTPAELPLPREKIERALIEREKEISTYLGHGVAVPHARFEGLDRPLLIFGRSTEGVPLGGSGERVYLFFVLLTPLSAPQFQVRLLARICGLMQNEFVVEQLRKTRDARRLLELVRAADPGTLG